MATAGPRVCRETEEASGRHDITGRMGRVLDGGMKIRALAFAALCLGACEREAAPPPAPAKPNILVYLPDSLRADHLDVYGYWRKTSPRLAEFSEGAVVFDRAYSQASWTKASVGTLFSGLYPSHHGAIRREHRLGEDFPTLAELLAADGYRTRAIIRNPIVLPNFGFGRCFESVIDLVKNRPKSEAEAIAEHALEFMSEDDPRPFFLYVHGFDPHFPYKAPPPFDERFRTPAGTETEQLIADYDNEIAYVDHAFGELMDRMIELGVHEDTAVVFLSDHGEEFKDHGLLSHGHTLYQEQIHVPLMVKFPHGEHAGRRIADRVRVIDVFPSLLELAGITPPAAIDGLSLLPLVQGGDERSYQPTLFFEQDLDRFELTALIDGRYKVIRRLRPRWRAGTQVFDLERDPYERDNLMKKQPELAQRMLEQLNRRESTIRGGIYIDFTNAVDTEKQSHVVGSIEITGGTVESLVPMLLEEGDSVGLADSRQRILFDLHLANHRAPIKGVRRETDIDRILFDLDGDDPSFSISLSVDAVDAEQFGVAVGASEAPSPSPLPWTSRGREADIRTTDRTSVEFSLVDTPYVRIYEITTPESGVVEIDPELDAQLKALGYMGDE